MVLLKYSWSLDVDYRALYNISIKSDRDCEARVICISWDREGWDFILQCISAAKIV